MKGKGRRKNGKKNSRKGSGSNTGPSSSALAYRGPVRPRNEASGTQVNLFRLSNTATVATSAGGVVGVYYANDASGVAEWSNFAAVFQEYRVIALSVRYVPRVNLVADLVSSTVTHGEICWYTARTTAVVTPATTLALAYEFAGSRVRPANRVSSHSWKMAGVEESVWTPVSAPVKRGGVVFTVFEAPASVTIGNVLLDYLVQFRARQ